jgi:hypothetical protein
VSSEKLWLAGVNLSANHDLPLIGHAGGKLLWRDDFSNLVGVIRWRREDEKQSAFSVRSRH